MHRCLWKLMDSLYACLACTFLLHSHVSHHAIQTVSANSSTNFSNLVDRQVVKTATIFSCSGSPLGTGIVTVGAVQLVASWWQWSSSYLALLEVMMALLLLMLQLLPQSNAMLLKPSYSGRTGNSGCSSSFSNGQIMHPSQLHFAWIGEDRPPPLWGWALMDGVFNEIDWSWIQTTQDSLANQIHYN